MLCLKCKYAYNHYNEIEEETLKQLVQEQLKEDYATWKQTIDMAYSDIARRYPVVKFCIKKLTWVVGNPQRPTQTIRQCEYFEEKQ